MSTENIPVEDNAAQVANDEISRRAAEIDQLAGLGPQTGDNAAPSGEALPPSIDFNAEASETTNFIAGMICAYCPACESTWNAETKSRVAYVLAPVLEKYGVSIGSLPPEIMLLIVAGPPLYQSSRLIALMIKEKESEQKANEKRNGPNNDVFDAQNTGRPSVVRPTGKTEPETPMQEVHPQMALYKNQ
jgi:hypothetical protein